MSHADNALCSRDGDRGRQCYSAYVPDLPGCVATGETVNLVENEIREAIRFHIDGLEADGLPVPVLTSIADYVQVSSFGSYAVAPFRLWRKRLSPTVFS